VIALLRGNVAHKGTDHAIIDVGGVGYRVNLPSRSLARLPPVGESALVHTHTHVREDALDLYGFDSPADRAVFLELISISGVGVKLAVAILGHLGASEIVSGVGRGDVRLLTSIKGVGKKTAERIILELGDRFGRMNLPAPSASSRPGSPVPVEGTTLEKLRSGLSNLGYAPQVVERAITDLGALVDDQPLEQLFRTALLKLRS
jgi:holliday junction DNA helicase RuvA